MIRPATFSLPRPGLIRNIQSLNVHSMARLPITSLSAARPIIFQKTAEQAPYAHVAAFFDIDRTLLFDSSHSPDGLKETLERFCSGGGQLFLITGRSLDQVKALPASFLNTLPCLAGLGVNYGTSVFLNPQNKSHVEWIQHLKPDQEDPVWRQEVHNRSEGWTLSEVLRLMHQAITEHLTYQGRHPRIKQTNRSTIYQVPKHHGVTVRVFPGRSSFIVEGSYQPDQKRALTIDLSASIQRKLQAAGFKLSAPILLGQHNQKTGEVYYIVDTLPHGVDKGALVRHILTQKPEIRCTITAGDSYLHDKAMLQDDYFVLPDGRRVPNHALVSEASELHQAVLHYRRGIHSGPIVTVAQSNLPGMALPIQLHTILDSITLPALSVVA